MNCMLKYHAGLRACQCAAGMSLMLGGRKSEKSEIGALWPSSASEVLAGGSRSLSEYECLHH